MSDVYQKTIDAYKSIFGKLDLADFDKRMQFQKTIYLLKFMGFDFAGLRFGWYRRGPYTFDLIGIKFKASDAGNSLTTTEKKWLSQHQKTIQELMEKPKDAELHSSIAYLQKEENLDEKQIIERMQLVKPWFTTQQVKKAIIKVNELSQINTESI